MQPVRSCRRPSYSSMEHFASSYHRSQPRLVAPDRYSGVSLVMFSPAAMSGYCHVTGECASEHSHNHCRELCHLLARQRFRKAARNYRCERRRCHKGSPPALGCGQQCRSLEWGTERQRAGWWLSERRGALRLWFLWYISRGGRCDGPAAAASTRGGIHVVCECPSATCSADAQQHRHIPRYHERGLSVVWHRFD